ncbi:HAD family hydrolase [Ktedonosporobacter rubrisoli]|uniref:HAD family hydrolase n=1 Tax=Ktedonosporobacter rubrisoli TaxID=2509675 RepID=UPI001A9347D9|nr:HAD-IIB family hydrolase [Ktedonosporobacter rubrisoli]
MRERGIQPLNIGHVIIATYDAYEEILREVVHELGLQYQMIFNKGSVMLLPVGVNKATGMMAALQELGISPHNTVGVGDAENDHDFLALCGCSVALANALPALKAQADYTTQAPNGEGVVELIEQLLADDLQDIIDHMADKDAQSS